MREAVVSSVKSSLYKGEISATDKKLMCLEASAICLIDVSNNLRVVSLSSWADKACTMLPSAAVSSEPMLSTTKINV